MPVYVPWPLMEAYVTWLIAGCSMAFRVTVPLVVMPAAWRLVALDVAP